MRLIGTWRPSKSFIWVQVPAGVPKMYESGFIKGKPYHMYIGDKIILEEEYPFTEICEECQLRATCSSGLETEEDASEAQIG